MTVTVAPNPAPTAMSGPEVLKGATWFDANWPFVGSFLFPIALVLPFLPFLFSRSSIKSAFQDALRSPYVLGWLPVAFYLSHQMEEHAYDLRGWRYAFVPGFNHGVGALLFDCPEGHLRCPLEPRITMEVNVACVWLGFVTAMIVAHLWRGPYAYAGMCNWGMAIVNSIGGHLIPWIFLGYNPGAFQSLFQTAFGIWAISRCPGTCRFALVCVFDGMIFHAVTFGLGANLVIQLHWPTEVVGFLSFLFTTWLPLFLAKLYAPRDYDKMMMTLMKRPLREKSEKGGCPLNVLDSCTVYGFRTDADRCGYQSVPIFASQPGLTKG